MTFILWMWATDSQEGKGCVNRVGGIRPENRQEDSWGQISGLPLLGQGSKRKSSWLGPTHCGLRRASGTSSYSAISLEDCAQHQIPSAGWFPYLSSACRIKAPVGTHRISVGVCLVETGLRPDMGHFWRAP